MLQVGGDVPDQASSELGSVGPRPLGPFYTSTQLTQNAYS